MRLCKQKWEASAKHQFLTSFPVELSVYFICLLCNQLQPVDVNSGFLDLVSVDTFESLVFCFPPEEYF